MIKNLSLFVLATSMLAITPLAGFASDERTISVSGSAQIRVQPDKVLITFGIETDDLDLLVSKRENERRIRDLMTALDEEGVENKHIQTDYLHVEPRYDYIKSERVFQGYWIRRNVVVTVTKIPKFESILTRALESGVNYVEGIDFRTTGLRKHRDEARVLAIRAAREKAVALAGELNQNVGPPITINESGGGFYTWYNRRQSNPAMQNVVQSVGGNEFDDDVTLAPGEISVSATVHVNFELR